MAFGKTAGCLILAGAALAAAQFPVRHEHLRKGCAGVLTVDENGVSFQGEKKHAWAWKYQDIQQLQMSPGKIRILTYKDSRVKLGADEVYVFTGEIPSGELYALWRDRLDQRFVAQMAQLPGAPFRSLAVKHLGRAYGSEGDLSFGPDSIVYSTAAKDESRTWRYSDIDTISSSGRFQLTITTLEKGFNFQLKQPITEAGYNELWLQIQKKNGRIQ